MTTSELIKLLQEADPDGTAHVRMDGGIPYYVEHLPGYYDGSYSYIEKDEDGNERYVITRQGSKVDIRCQDISDFIDNYLDLHDPNNLEYVLSKFKLDKDERSLDWIKNKYSELWKLHNDLFQNNVKKGIENAKKGWRWFQNMNVDKPRKKGEINMDYYYTWVILDESGKEQGSCPANNEYAMNSGLWKKIISKEREGYYEWVYKGE
jgi:hypothetical protein